MKESLKIFLSVFILLSFASKLHAQDTLDFEGFKTPKFAQIQNIIKTCPIPLLMGQIPYCGELRISYERMITHNQSLTFGASYNYKGPVYSLLIRLVNPAGVSSWGNVKINGARFILSHRYYPFKTKAPKGFFFGPYLSYNFAKIQEKNGTGDYDLINYINASLVCGYQAKLGEHIYFEFIGGFGYKRNFVISYDSHTKQSSTEDLYNKKFSVFRNVKFDLSINFGYAF